MRLAERERNDNPSAARCNKSGLAATLEVKLADRLVPTSDISVLAPNERGCGLTLTIRHAGYPRDDEADVYEAVLRQMFGGNHAWRVLVVASETGESRMYEHGGPDFDGVGADTFEDYRAQNRAPKRFGRLQSLPATLVLLDRGEFSKMFKTRGGDAWTRFEEKYPDSNGFIEFSAVGFDRTRDEALVYVSRNCGWSCAAGWYVLLRKDADGWRVEKQLLSWQASSGARW
jgi:hypothetical protein